MKKLIIGSSLVLLSSAMIFFLEDKLNEDFENGRISKEIVTETVGENSVSFLDYKYDNFLTKTYKTFKDPKPLKKEYKFIFKGDEYISKEVYFIKNDSLTISYDFEKDSEVEKDLKKQIFKNRFKMFKNEEVLKIYKDKNSNIMQSSYLIEFKEPKEISYFYEYTSQFRQKDENKMKVFSELSFISNYRTLKNKYKRVNIVFSNKDNGLLFRNLVSENLDNAEVNQSFNLIYENK